MDTRLCSRIGTLLLLLLVNGGWPRPAAADSGPRALRVDVTPLLKALRAGNHRRRQMASEALAVLGEPLVPTLADMLGDKNADVRAAVMSALSSMGPKARKAVPSLAAMIGVKDQREQWLVSRTLACIGEPALGAVMKRLAHADRGVRIHAAKTFSEMRNCAAPAIPGLWKALRDRDGQVCFWANNALGVIGKPAYDFLMANRKDEHPRARAAAVDILARYVHRFPPAAAAVSAGLADESPDVRSMGAAHLHCLPAAQAQAGLLKALVDKVAVVREAAVGAARSTSDHTPAVLSLIRRRLRDENERVRNAAIYALPEIAPSDPRTLADLSGIALDEKNSALIRVAAVQTLGRIAPHHQGQVVPLLLKAYRVKALRVPVLAALRDMGRFAAEAVPFLKEIATDKDDAVREYAKRALERIGRPRRRGMRVPPP